MTAHPERIDDGAPGRWALVLNFAAFQGGWFACVLSAARGTPWIGTAIAAAIVAVHVARSRNRAGEAKLVAIALALGAAWDSTLVAAGWVGFSSGTFVERAAPHWILALWALFAITLNSSLRWLRGSVAVAVGLGAIAGPLSYWAGERLGAVMFLQPLAAIAALAAGWAVLTPALVAVARVCDKPGAASA